jgi:photosystem II stability/assembly factor-like uncharacterized protein
VSVTFVSPQTGWVLDIGGCCGVRLWQTRDAGTSWTQVNAPPVAQSNSDRILYGVRFANLNDGYVFGKTLWATHDGGANWTQVAYPHATDNTEVERLEISGRVAYAVISPFEVEHRYRLLSTPVDHEAWTDLFAYGQDAAPVQSAELVAQGDRAYALFNFRVVGGGAIALSGTARAWQPPCLDTFGTAKLAASSATELVALCNEGMWGGTRATTVRVSHDGGARFTTTREVSDLKGLGNCLASSSPTSIFLGGSQFAATFDGGKTWETVWSSDAQTSTCQEMGFTTPTQGVAIVVGEAPALLMTKDGGHTWQPVAI